eukprot:TRINITY_DN75720_c0_g1_i1.p1 TRINITY_DN75720_c0_g1~~TRINITY_DN75720_c0_g1_i1.p1  ORF type:complete len:641 (+),score=148.01 TRINITY_DN75720_c0_g1_i1:246-1925(+)
MLKTRLGADGRVYAGQEQELAAGTATMVQVGEASAAENMEFLTKTLKRFQSFSESAQQSVASRHQNEEVRLQEAIEKASDPIVKEALKQSVEGNRESLRETQGIYGNMASFSDKMLSLLNAATKTGYGCDQLSCGLHASCSDTMEGALCFCDEGYIGSGKDCRAPPEFMPHFLVSRDGVVKAADMHVSLFDGNKIAVVYRDEKKNDAGALVVGTLREEGLADLSPPELFTAAHAKAFDPVVAGTDGKRIAVAWRDQNEMGNCMIKAAAMGLSGIRGAEMALTWGHAHNFCSNQAHKMSIMPFKDNRVMVLYSDKVQASEHAPVESFGNSILTEIGSMGNISSVGNFRFTDNAVARLEATRVSPNGFVLAVRAARGFDDMNPQSSTMQEAMAIYGELVGDDLVFNPNVVNLEPNQGQIWARGLSLIAENTVAYAYQDGQSMEMKIAVLDVDPVSHRMKVLQTPAAFSKGFTPYVSMLSMPYTESDPHTLTYYQGLEGASVVNLCSWDKQFRALRNCEDFTWLSEKISTVSGTPLSGGKTMMVFASEAGVPYYSVFGLSKK